MVQVAIDDASDGRSDKLQTLRNTVDDTVSRFLYYDRKEDEDLPRGEIERMVQDGEVTVGEIVERFRFHLEKSLKEGAAIATAPATPPGLEERSRAWLEEHRSAHPHGSSVHVASLTQLLADVQAERDRVVVDGICAWLRSYDDAHRRSALAARIEQGEAAPYIRARIP